ncbi:SAM-dependent methyltransferase [Spirochaetia bacterium]|nr:SAM-dependent methyltransferase [Spirochaetia bacterium]
MSVVPLAGRVFQAVPGFEDHLRWELGRWNEAWGDCQADVDTGNSGNAAFARKPSQHPALYYVDDDTAPSVPPFWTRNVWLEPFRLEFESISEAAAALRTIQRNWAPALFTQFRRGALIAEKLPSLPVKRRTFPWLLPDLPMGSWTLLDAHTMIASARCASPFPNGVIEFEEDKEGPPSRAYLKLWEALVLSRKWPGPGQRCLDAGASPGGWTWALAKLGAEVIAVDRAPLEDRVLSMPGVSFIKHDAFTLNPEDIGPVDWLFCDVICYPARLYAWIEKWLASGLCRNFVCTIKMQGAVNNASTVIGDRVSGGESTVSADEVPVSVGESGNSNQWFDTASRFAAIPGSKVVHLYHNKHELTWIKT